MVIEKIAQGNKKVPAGFYVLNNTLNHNQKKKPYIPEIHVHLELSHTTVGKFTVHW